MTVIADPPRIAIPAKTRPEVAVRPLSEQDLGAVVEIYVAANPKSLLTSFGHAQIRHYLSWQLKARHMAAATVAEVDGQVAGILLLVKNNDLPGYLKGNKWFLSRSFVRNIGVLFTPLFRARAKQCIRCLVNPPKSWKGQPGTVRVLCIAVHPQFQGNGIGGELLKSAEELAYSRGHDRAELTVNPSNVSALRFYERWGWQKLTVDGQWAGAMEKRFSR
jgi:ribosomal protein S18 acetylase RimI-like enzyme